ncbi:MAG: hypothetical protein JRI25_05860 [Deltaproteobacteria bacterium]|nr:hypothetical protein [Deltaproteobacteria bacterium]MBW2254110.1 hypothetical protein [Deltaproteobacteria bacterium]
MMITLLLSFAAFATPPADYSQVKERGGCTYYNGPTEEDGTRPMRAECHWPDLTFERIDGLLSKWEDHDLYHSSVVAADIVGQDGDAVLVHQEHHTAGISNRELTLRLTKEVLPNGARYPWTMIAEQPEPAKGNVVPVRDDGYWEVTAAADGGVDVVYDLKYSPGGRVPGFIVKWFQTSGLVAVVEDFYEHATGSE